MASSFRQPDRTIADQEVQSDAYSVADNEELKQSHREKQRPVLNEDFRPLYSIPADELVSLPGTKGGLRSNLKNSETVLQISNRYLPYHVRLVSSILPCVFWSGGWQLLTSR